MTRYFFKSTFLAFILLRDFSLFASPLEYDLLLEIYKRSPMKIKLTILKLHPPLLTWVPIDVNELINDINPALDFQEDSIDAGIKNRSPVYINIISKILDEKVRNFSEKKLGTLQTEQDVIEHFYCLIFLMGSYNSASKSLADDAAWEFGKNEAEWASQNSELKTAVEAARNAGEDISTLIARTTTWNTEKLFLSKDAKRSVAQAFNDKKDRIKISSLVSPKQIGQAIYFIAEKASLLELLKNFDAIIEKSYCECLERIKRNKHKLTLDKTIRDWKKFKEKYFYFEEDASWYSLYSKIKKGSKLFLIPWLNELDRIAIKIEDFSA